MAEAGGWIEHSDPRPSARCKLYCFPYAGGAAQAYRPWNRELPREVQVCPLQLPGRWSRRQEPAFTAIEPLVRAATDALLPTMDRPFALFGHSLGALIAFEVCRELRRRGALLPELLIVSGRKAPQLPNPHPPLDARSDDEFIRQMQQRYNGIPAAVLASRDLLEILLPAIKADMAVFDGYAYEPEPPLRIPIAVYGGDEDLAAPRAELELWQEQTTATCRVRMFPGGHFFLGEGAKEAVIAALKEDTLGAVSR